MITMRAMCEANLSQPPAHGLQGAQAGRREFDVRVREHDHSGILAFRNGPLVCSRLWPNTSAYLPHIQWCAVNRGEVRVAE